MISISPNGRLAAFCSAGRLQMVCGDVRHEEATADDAVVVAFDDQVWLFEGVGKGIRIRRLSERGDLLGEQELQHTGAPRYAKAMESNHVSAVVGGKKRTVIVRLDGNVLMGSDVRSHPRQVIPARNLVMIQGGDVRVGRAGEGRKLNRAGMRVSDAWPLLGGSALALFGKDNRGQSVDVVGMKQGILRARLRVEPGVIVSASSQGGRLVFVHGRALTVFDVVERRNVLKKELETAPIAIAVDAIGGFAAVGMDSGALEVVELRPQSETSEETRRRGASDSAAGPERGSDQDGPFVLEDHRGDDEPRATGSRAAIVAEAAPTLLAGGKFISSGKPRGELEIRSPADPDDVIGVFPYGEDDIDTAVAAAAAATRRWGNWRLEQRSNALRSFDEELRARSKDLIARMERETGRPHWECSREVHGLSHRLEYTLAGAAVALKERADRVSSGLVRSRPLGVVAVIGPAMFPLATSHQHIIAAIAAGNTVVWKPSPLCAATAQLYAEALCASDLPAGVANVAQGSDEVGADLVAHTDVDCVVFTGSTGNGTRVREQTAARMTQKQILHLGAKNAAVVAADCVLELAAYEIATSAFMSAGQRCTAISRVFVHEQVLDDFIAQVRAICAAFRIGPPGGEAGKQAFYGPMLGRDRLERFQAALDAAPEQGAAPLLRGAVVDRPGYFVEPSLHLVEEVHSGSPYQDEELFGPDLAIHPVSGLDEAIRLCNDSPYGLCCALFTEDNRFWKRFTREVRVGTVLLNVGTHSISGRLPFGGIKASGQGGRSGADAILALRREISVQERRSELVDIWPGTRSPEGNSPS